VAEGVNFRLEGEEVFATEVADNPSSPENGGGRWYSEKERKKYDLKEKKPVR